MAYPQLCVGLVLDTPTVRFGSNAVTALTRLTELGFPAGTCAAGRAYTGGAPETFQTPVRRLGYRLTLDDKAENRGKQGSRRGALLINGSLACPHMPTALAQATQGAKDESVRMPSEELQRAIEERGPYFLKTKQGPDARGALRLQCPAADAGPPGPAVVPTRPHDSKSGLAQPRSAVVHHPDNLEQPPETTKIPTDHGDRRDLVNRS
ncbi:hypothetical protein [Streptomyces sp. NPDC058773]|uniref:hypothetical protein n=1 Tax=Streptomyces sp. NPDC058773 TaxID=3346632 RepID=UPI0036787EE6